MRPFAVWRNSENPVVSVAATGSGARLKLSPRHKAVIERDVIPKKAA